LLKIGFGNLGTFKILNYDIHCLICRWWPN